jgi:hypothetical protein
MIADLLVICGLPILLSMILALPPALKKNSLATFFIASVLSFLIVVLPLFFFFVSAFLSPEWKGACTHGWLDCFVTGKTALAPLAFWATAALYSVEVLRVKNRTEAWIVLGIFSGAVISVVCLMFGLICLCNQPDTGRIMAFMLVPFYVAIWYSARAVQLIKESKLETKACLTTLLGSLPFWIGSLLWAKSAYASLPNSQPDCFIVTAAGRGHRKIVGPFFNLQRRGRLVQANQQLITFWQFESFWRDRAPRTHACFRRFYNRFGPAIAAQIRSPLLADLAYVALKPVEIAAKLANSTLRRVAALQTERGSVTRSNIASQGVNEPPAYFSKYEQSCGSQSRAPKQADLNIHLNINEN